MPDDIRSLPASAGAPPALFAESLAVASLPISLQIFFNDGLFERCKAVSHYIAKAEGIAPRHLIGKPEACFAVVSRALTWKLDPYAVAQATYQTPGGQVGYYGALCQAILETSGRLDGGVRFRHYGDWDAVRGKFRIATSEKGTKYPVPAWRPEDEIGLGVKVVGLVKGEAEERYLDFDLIQAFPRNSTLWATDPKTQICYTAVRRFATSVVPMLFMGVGFDREEIDEWASALKDVTPARPQLREYQPAEADVSRETSAARPTRRRKAEPEPATEPPPSDPPPFAFTDVQGEIHEFHGADEAVEALAELLGKADLSTLEALWENAAMMVSALRESGHDQLVENLHQLKSQLAAALDQPQPQGPNGAESAAAAAPAASGRAAGSDYAVLVPMPADSKSSQSWYAPARKKLREMLDAKRPPADFERFKAENAANLQRVSDELSSWYVTLDRMIADGLAGRSPG